MLGSIQNWCQSYDKVGMFHEKGKAVIISNAVQVQTLYFVLCVLLTASVTLFAHCRHFFGICILGYIVCPLCMFRVLCVPNFRWSVKLSS